MTQFRNIRTMAAIVVSLSVSAAQATVLVENFDYGPADINSGTLGSAGDGWSSGWNLAYYSDYDADVNLTSSVPGYGNADNDATTGALTGSAANGSAQQSTRTFSSTLDATSNPIWVSFLSNLTGPDSRHNNFELPSDQGGGKRLFVSHLDAGAVRLWGSLGTKQVTGLDNTQTQLVLMKVEANVGGSNDPVSIWVNPDMSGGEAGLPAPDIYDGTVDWLTTGPDQVQLSIQRSANTGEATGWMDALRLSNEPEGLDSITGISDVVPEPASLSLLALGGLALVRRRRKG